ncbi:MAG: hypothetical protein Q8P67_11025 [archaeon]|nr:hypothetical protein [archaeon]
MMASDSSSMADDQACVESVRDAGTPSQTSGRFDPITAHLKITEKGREEVGERLEALEEANGPEWPKEASWQSPADEAVLSLTNFCDRGQVADFWATKDRLDALFESPFNIGQYYYLERTRFFKAATGDSASASKGTGPVFAELLAAAGVSPSSEAQCNVVDICGGPGLQSEYFLGLNARNRAWGMTFESQDTRKHPSWSPRLLGNPCFTHVVGHHRDGNPCRPENLRYLKDQICGLGQTISYVLCDGFVSVKSAKGPRGQAFRCENLQESFNLRLLVSELLAALLTLSEDGHVIIKVCLRISFLFLSFSLFLSLSFSLSLSLSSLLLFFFISDV